MSYCLLAKTFLKSKEVARAINYGFILYYRDNFEFNHSIGDILIL